MNIIKIEASFEVFEDKLHLPKEIESLMNQAIEVRDKAYAPYSKFNVGAAILLDNDQIVTGSNQENAAFPSGLCAERVAIFQAGSLYPDIQIKAICISAASQIHVINKPIPPCGACRQSIAEYEQKQKNDIAIYFMGQSGQVYKANSLKDLLPLSFDNQYL